jgi:predicted regulator of Ras-like GTPase activity (Roadblock/LC7/MglB family)
MTSRSADNRLTILISSLLVMAPMVVFPAQLGMRLASGSFIYALIEIAFYGLAFFIFYPKANFGQIIQGAGLAFIYRIVLGSVFGLMIALMYGVGVTAALTLGVSKYLPAILIQILAAPFALRAIYLKMIGADIERRRHYIKRYQPPAAPRAEETTHPQTQRHGEIKTTAPEHLAFPAKSELTLGGHEANGFDRAVNYLGEHHTVLLAAVIDYEGLVVASYKKDRIDAEEWAPLALLLSESNEKILSRLESRPKTARIDLSFDSKKMTVIRTGDLYLMTLSLREDEELVGIRTAQAVEMIKKYKSERYGKVNLPSPEEQYVSNT